MISNNARVARALYLLKLELDNFVPREFSSHHDDQVVTVLNQILSQNRDAQRPFHNMKTQDLLVVVQASWWNVFDRAMGGIEPGLVREVAFAHENWASRHNFSGESAYQVLSAVQQLLAAMSCPSTLELDMLKRECLESEIEVDIEEAEEALASSVDVPAAGVEPTPSQSDETPVEEPAEVTETISTGEAGAQAVDEDPYMAELVRLLVESSALQEQDYVARASTPAAVPRYPEVAIFPDLNSALLRSLADLNVERLLAYQEEALAVVLAGGSVALEAGRASDEFLSWSVPMAEALQRSPGSNGLVLCPDEPSAAHAAAQLEGLYPSVGLSVINASADTSALAALAALDDSEPPFVLIATPDVLNASLAGLGDGWLAFMRCLRFVVIDQAQQYQGRFGANIAVLLRRLFHRLAILGASPQALAVVQGSGNAGELALILTGRSFEEIRGLDGPASGSHFLFVDPLDLESPGLSNIAGRIARAALACADAGKSVAVCCGPSLLQTSWQAAQSLNEANGGDESRIALGLDGTAPSPHAGEAEDSPPAPGRALFLTASRASAGLLREFDGLILAGQPATFSALLQLAEGVGNANLDNAFALFFSAGSAADRFAAHNLASLLAMGPDHTVVDPDLAEVIRPHLPALLQELEGRVYSFSRDVLGNAVFQSLRREGPALDLEGDDPTPEAPLGPQTRENWMLVSEGESLGSVSPYGKFREVYPGSVIVFDGAKYRAAFIEPGAGFQEAPEILLERSDALANLRTVPTFDTAVTVTDESLRLSPAQGISLYLGRASAEETLTSVSVVDESGNPGFDGGPDAGSEAEQDLVTATFTPEEEISWQLTAPAFWMDLVGLLDEGVADTEGEDSPAAIGSVVALEQMLRVGARFTFPVNQYDLATYSQGATIFLVEVSPAAQGIAKKTFDLWREILTFGANVARQCRCASGCTWCLLPCSPWEGSLDKAGGLLLAERLLAATEGS
ncbi:MAG: Swt1 family HEPN domain-containing protein [Chloroflexi bacterium]|nr:Swt1 family HEPN domain-containing protein [Chloroflexota bacterium]